MSFILNALQKSEAERREQQQAPDLLAIQTPSTPDSSGNRLPRRWQLLSALLLISVVVLGYKLLVQTSQPAPQTVQLTQDTAASARAQPTNAAKNMASTVPATDNQPAKSQSSINDNKTLDHNSAGNSEPPATRALSDTLKTVETPTTNAQVIDLYQQPSDSSAEQRLAAASSLTNEQQALAERAQQLKREMAEPQIPAIHNLPLALQDRLPKMVYSAHIYSSDADSGFAIINDRRRYRGDQISPGLIVVSVMSTGVVLTFEGHTFRLDAMKNWPLE
ncbi:general secretion pathway protein GspB [Simiduia curdlanivorans]|uniref:General secretion pathway protein GspB n=1 Tax=Simiduia curdlanivorans TaxID=1492769 RepID=A0ABV8V567_9GAMM|nr:general secretion pathway protein GspB [Simiduia curdlanivorans]MDN3640734.1 general secretion pathway protein GspB [Simiduia curdlanivorans]